jgi:ABC-type antimicrobial peptide transport system permease subunit
MALSVVLLITAGLFVQAFVKAAGADLAFRPDHVGIVLAVIGLYGVISFIVEHQTQEIGVRMALGATRCSLLYMVFGNGISMVTVGLVTGLTAAIVVTRFMSILLIGIGPWDVKTSATIAMVLLDAAVFASWIPAPQPAH